MGGMKRHMKLMQIYDIEKNYQLHKQRLSNIKSIDNKNKIIEDVWTNIEKINHYKKHRITSDLFTEKEKIFRINTENINLKDKMQEVSQRPHFMLTQQKQKKEAKSESRMLRKKSLFDNIAQENQKIKERLNKTKSSYFKITKNLSKSQVKKRSHQDEIIYLLEKQLKISPQVMFPTLRSNPKAEKHQKSIELREESKQSRLSRSGSKQNHKMLTSKVRLKQLRKEKAKSNGNSFG